MVTNPFRKQKSLTEMEEETEQKQAENGLVGVELSIAQKREAIRQLKERGLTPRHFLFDWGKIIKWLKSH